MLSLLVALLIAATALAQNPPQILPFPGVAHNFRQMETGVPFSLDCAVAETSPAPEVTWYKDGAVLLEGDGGLELAGATLHFRRPEAARHAGRYHCLAANEHGTAKSAVVQMSGQPAPRHAEHESAPAFTKEPAMAINPIGSLATFTCAAKGSPEPEIIWTKNGEELTAFRNQEQLSFEQITPDDIATYACNASNSVGYVYKTVFLSILTQKPFFTEVLINRSASIGQEVLLRCAARGFPKPTISWSRQGRKIELGGNYAQADRGDLIIRKVAADSAGVYECNAANAQGAAATSGELDVVSTTTITSGPLDMRARVRGVAKMACEVLWDPSFALNVLWKKNNVDIDFSRDDRIEMDADNSLVIRELKFEDLGTYTCVASTSQGSTTKSGTLTVDGIPPTWVSKPTDQTVPEESTIVLNCTVDSFPVATHTWFKNVDRVNLTDPRFSVSHEGTLRIADAKQNDSSDKYVCRANNGAGEVVASAFIDVRKATKIISANPEYHKFVEGNNYSMECAAEFDPKFEGAISKLWRKDDEPVNVSDSEVYAIDENFTLYIHGATMEEVGRYECVVSSPMDEKVVKTSIYADDFEMLGFWWLFIIIIVAIVLALLLVLCICCVCVVRKRSRRKGRYGVKDIADGTLTNGGKHNRSDIRYSIDEEGDGIANDLLDSDEKRKIIKPAANGASGSKHTIVDEINRGASETSLLHLAEEDLWLRKGMDEDGSFREGRYAD